MTGRITKDGKPLPGGAVGLVQANRGVQTFVGEYRAATDAKGAFRIPNVPPEDAFVLYGLMDSLKNHGAIAAQPLRTGKTGTEMDAGDLAVGPGHRLAGRLMLSDGKPVPAGVRVLISREEAWDSQQTMVEKDGSFAFMGLPPERCSLSARVPGYHLSAANASVDLLNPFRLLGMVRADITGLRLLYDPGEMPPRQPERDKKWAEEFERRRSAPLRGVLLDQ